MNPLGVLFGVLAMICWGMGDVIVKKLAINVGTFHSVLYRTFFSTITLFFVTFFFVRTFSISLNALLSLMLVSFFGFIGYFLFVKGVKVGNVSVVSPIAHASVIISVLLSVFLFKEVLTSLQIIAMVLLIIGVILISFKYSEIGKGTALVKGLGYAVAAFFIWGINFSLWKIPLSFATPFLVAFYIEFFIFLYGMILLIPLRKKLFHPNLNKSNWIMAISVGIIISLGSLFYTLGLNLEFVSLVAPIAASSPLISVILARIFLKERLEFNQKSAVLFVIAGLILISL